MSDARLLIVLYGNYEGIRKMLINRVPYEETDISLLDNVIACRV